MSLWQYNAWCEAYQDRIKDTLSLQLQAAYMGAYWSGASKHKKSLMRILNSLYETEKVPIDVKKVSEEFRQYEELKNYGWTK
jgi:hypothetical protein